MALESLCGFSGQDKLFSRKNAECFDDDLEVMTANFASNTSLMMPPALRVSS